MRTNKEKSKLKKIKTLPSFLALLLLASISNYDTRNEYKKTHHVKPLLCFDRKFDYTLGVQLGKPTCGGKQQRQTFPRRDFCYQFFAILIPCFMMMQATMAVFPRALLATDLWNSEVSSGLRRLVDLQRKEARFRFLYILGRSSSSVAAKIMCPLLFCHIRSKRAMFKLCSNHIRNDYVTSTNSMSN